MITFDGTASSANAVFSFIMGENQKPGKYDHLLGERPVFGAILTKGVWVNKGDTVHLEGGEFSVERAE
jgi:hypothetical protein